MPKLGGNPDATLQDARMILKHVRQEARGQRGGLKTRQAAEKVWLAVFTAADALVGLEFRPRRCMLHIHERTFMRNILLLAATLSSPAILSADTLVLKDGSKVEWHSLRDQGDSYEVETARGTKITVKKSDVERFDRSIPQDPLTGATFTFDKKTVLVAVDVMRTLDAKKGLQTGSWKVSNGTLNGSHGGIGKFQLGLTPPEEYDLSMTVERQDESHGELFVGLVGGGKQFTFHFNAYEGCWTGYSVVDGKHVQNGGIPKKIIVDKSARKVVFMVRKEGVSTWLDGKELLTWTGDWKRISLLPDLVVPDRSTLFLGVVGSSYRWSNLILSYPKER
jgi:hypothetical protein